jgi:hypothetical protein
VGVVAGVGVLVHVEAQMTVGQEAPVVVVEGEEGVGEAEERGVAAVGDNM